MNNIVTFLQANGLVERFNQTLQNMLVKYLDDKKEMWEQLLDTCVFSYNTSKQESSQYAPFELMFARKPVLPIEINIQQKEPETLLKQFNEASDLSLTSIQDIHHAHEKVLEVAKANILKAQKQQKEQYDRRNHKPGEYFK